MLDVCSVQESILSSICVLRPLWKCFQYQGQFAASVAASVAGREENQFWPRVLFEGSDVKETKFATRNCYEVQSAQVIEQLDRRLDQIISGISFLYSVSPEFLFQRFFIARFPT